LTFAAPLALACVSDDERGRERESSQREVTSPPASGRGHDAAPRDRSQRDGDAMQPSRQEPFDSPKPRRPDASSSDVSAMRAEVCADPFQVGQTTFYRASLDTLCQALGQRADSRCPKDLAAALAGVAEQCAQYHSFPFFTRGCGYDRLEVYEAGLWKTWTFDEVSGALVGARFASTELGCGPGIHVGGAQRDGCSGRLERCELCLGGPARDAQCPAEVVRSLPSRACSAPPSTSSACSCRNDGLSDLPVEGSLCDGAQGCERCELGTCWADCVCMRDGTRRWRHGCTE
jgi:hypothetical protein